MRLSSRAEARSGDAIRIDRPRDRRGVHCGDAPHDGAGGALAQANKHVIVDNCLAGCGSAASSTLADGTANGSVPQAGAFISLFNGTTWDRARGDITSGLWVNLKSSVVVHTICDSGCGSAAAVAMTDTTSNPTIPQTAAFSMVYNGATWDRGRGDTTAGAWVNLKSSVVLHAIIDSGSLSVSNFPATYDTSDRAARLLGHVVIDTGANVVGSISNTAFIANAGTNLNTSALALDATVTNRLPAGSTPANGESNAITTSRLGSYMFVFNGATWDRFTGAITGTVSANQAGTWTVQPGNTANSTPWLTTDSADGNTGAAVPTKAAFIGVRDSTANMSGVIQCDKFALAAIASAANTQLVAISGSTVIYVCSYVIEIQGIVTTAGTNKLNYGTGTACATGTVQVTPDYIGNVTAGVPTVITQNAALGYLFKTTAGQALCSTTTTTTVQKVFVTYAQF
jgi:hypothetical protein